MNDALVSLIRTYVPIGVGAVLSWLLTLGITVDDSAQAGLIAGITAVVTASYYALVRLAELRFPWLGVLLGTKRQPTYDTSKVQLVDGRTVREVNADITAR